MSSIVGVIDFKNNLLEYTDKFHQMNGSLSHRGPDSQGTYITQNAALGCNRLSIVDPVGGVQPMTRRLGEDAYTIVYNGEIYNAGSLRAELLELGHTFLTQSDTEVVLLSYIEWGVSCVERFDGMFAFAVLEEPRMRLFLARDRLGAKPLYYADLGGIFVFASEIKALLKHPAVHPVVDEQGLMTLFALSPCLPPGKTLFRDIHSICPGECMMYSRLGTYIHRYWQLEAVGHTDSLDTTVEKVRDLVVSSVKRQIPSDASYTCLLSGGLDSSAICSIINRNLESRTKKLHTFSIEYEDNAKYFQKNVFQSTRDEIYIEIMQKYLQSEHMIYNITIDQLIDSLRAGILARDLPGMADVDSSLLLACREIKKYSDVVISGECADEIFGGYPWFYREDLLFKDVFPWSDSISLRTSIMAKDLAHLKVEEFAKDSYLTALSSAPMLAGESPRDARIRKMFYVCLNWFGANLIDRKDRMSMASGLEARMPFADAKLASYVFNIPFDMKNAGGKEKGILRLAVGDYLPEEVLNRKKCPFPKTHNPIYEQKITKVLLEILHDPTSPIHEILDTATLIEMAQNGSQILMPWFGQLMTGPQFFAYLVGLDIWLREYSVAFQV